jgi:hypothetical protein
MNTSGSISLENRYDRVVRPDQIQLKRGAESEGLRAMRFHHEVHEGHEEGLSQSAQGTQRKGSSKLKGKRDGQNKISSPPAN